MTVATLIHSLLDRARKELLDLSTRNRLIHTPLDKPRGKLIPVVDEVSEEIFRLLVREGKAMTFMPGAESADGEVDATKADGDFAQPEYDAVGNDGILEHHTDTRMQTAMTSEGLQKRLLGIYYDARTYEEEQGVNILYLALGFLKWFEAENSDRARYAPLILVPIELERQNVGTKFRVRALEEDIETNLSLQAMLNHEFGVRLPELSKEDKTDKEDISPASYYAQVRQAVSSQKRWEVMPNAIVLGFFSFAKFLMYRDLDPQQWPAERAVDKHSLVNGLLDSGFSADPPLCGNDDKIDALVAPAAMLHVIDADSSQTIAVEEVRRGRNLVIQGPPGTGKSQTIANAIAAAVKEGKKVLFVAEKMAALEVVKRRLDNIGLGDICLELHSNKVSKRIVVEELRRTWDLGRPKSTGIEKLIERLTAARDRLNAHADTMHARLDPSGLTPFKVIGELVRLRRKGIEPPSFHLVDPLDWTPSQFQDRLNLLSEVVEHLKIIGTPEQHLWRGVMLASVLPTDAQRLTAQLPGLITAIDQLVEAVDQIASELQLPKAANSQQIMRVCRVAYRIASAPPVDGASIRHAVWKDRRSDIKAVVKQGIYLSDLRTRLTSVVAPLAWETDLADARRQIAAHGRSFLRWFNTRYRQAQTTLRGILTSDPPKSVDARLEILDSVLAAQKASADLQENDLGPQAFGSLWQGADSDWAALAAIDKWEEECQAANLPSNFRDLLGATHNVVRLGSAAKRAANATEDVLKKIQRVFEHLQLDLAVAFGGGDIRKIALPSIRERLIKWNDDPESLSRWITFRSRWSRLAAEGMADLGEQLHQGSITADTASELFRMAYYESVLREMFARWPKLAEFDGQTHEQTQERFRELDRKRIELARYEVLLAHFNGIPQQGVVGETATIKREINKKRGHLPLRQLLKKAGHAIQAIKPVFMMSPISVAQFLEPGVLDFDLLLIDEASQVRPVDALGAIARAKQVVVVGDDKQLPPTRFFDKMLEADDTTNEDETDFAVGKMDSILGLCSAQGVGERMLRWHYRSRHHSLIAVSNREFYESKLFVVPSPIDQADNQGLQFHYIPDGVFERGGSATNPVEARRVAEAVMRHAREQPHFTLGVGTFSVAQRDAILNELELLRRAEPERESFFLSGVAEPFFVKNLENIQGDERDVIFISIGYGRNPEGYMAMNFGPLQNDGGERRLNVLITRARVRCDVFSSITADDIDLERARSRGSAALKSFLNYAQKGLLDIARPTGGDHDSEFEQEVARALAAYGFEVEAQIGVAGFFVDLAVRDPKIRGRYLLGIECDGAAYHSSRSARDRDRLRQQVLEANGWQIHRIWSTDWFRRPNEQVKRLLDAIERARIDLHERHNGLQNPTPNGAVTQPTVVERLATDEEEDEGKSLAVPYKQARVRVPSGISAISDLSLDQLTGLATAIVEVEGPIHYKEVARRAVELMGAQRTTKKATMDVHSALKRAVRQGQLTAESCFYWKVGTCSEVVRDRSQVTSVTLRKPEMLPPREIRQALLKIITSHMGTAPDDAIVQSSRLLGFSATSSQLRELIGKELQKLIEGGAITRRNESVYAGSN